MFNFCVWELELVDRDYKVVAKNLEEAKKKFKKWDFEYADEHDTMMSSHKIQDIREIEYREEK